MRCGKAQRMASAALDGELASTRQAALRQHLDSCHACRAFATGLEMSREALGIWQAPEPQWGAADRVMRRLAAGPGRGARSRLGWLRPAPLGLGAAAFCFGVALAVLGSNGAAATEPTSEQAFDTLAGEYVSVVSEDTVETSLLALLPETEG